MKPIYLSIFTNNIRSYLVLSMVPRNIYEHIYTYTRITNMFHIPVLYLYIPGMYVWSIFCFRRGE